MVATTGDLDNLTTISNDFVKRARGLILGQPSLLKSKSLNWEDRQRDHSLGDSQGSSSSGYASSSATLDIYSTHQSRNKTPGVTLHCREAPSHSPASDASVSTPMTVTGVWTGGDYCRTGQKSSNSGVSRLSTRGLKPEDMRMSQSSTKSLVLSSHTDIAVSSKSLASARLTYSRKKRVGGSSSCNSVKVDSPDSIHTRSPRTNEGTSTEQQTPAHVKAGGSPQDMSSTLVGSARRAALAVDADGGVDWDAVETRLKLSRDLAARLEARSRELAETSRQTNDESLANTSGRSLGSVGTPQPRSTAALPLPHNLALKRTQNDNDVDDLKRTVASMRAEIELMRTKVEQVAEDEGRQERNEILLEELRSKVESIMVQLEENKNHLALEDLQKSMGLIPGSTEVVEALPSIRGDVKELRGDMQELREYIRHIQNTMSLNSEQKAQQQVSVDDSNSREVGRLREELEDLGEKMEGMDTDLQYIHQKVNSMEWMNRVNAFQTPGKASTGEKTGTPVTAGGTSRVMPTPTPLKRMREDVEQLKRQCAWVMKLQISKNVQEVDVSKAVRGLADKIRCLVQPEQSQLSRFGDISPTPLLFAESKMPRSSQHEALDSHANTGHVRRFSVGSDLFDVANPIQLIKNVLECMQDASTPRNRAQPDSSSGTPPTPARSRLAEIKGDITRSSRVLAASTKKRLERPRRKAPSPPKDGKMPSLTPKSFNLQVESYMDRMSSINSRMSLLDKN